MCRAPPSRNLFLSLPKAGVSGLSGLSGDGCSAASDVRDLPPEALVLAVGAQPVVDPPDVCWPEPASIDLAKSTTDAAPLVTAAEPPEVAFAGATAVPAVDVETSLHAPQNHSPSGTTSNGFLMQVMCHLQTADAQVQHNEFFGFQF